MADIHGRIFRQLNEASQPAEAARHRADLCLAIALTAELLDLGGAAAPLTAAAEGDFSLLGALTTEVERTTGFSFPEVPRGVTGRRVAQADLFTSFTRLRLDPDPFGLLGQELRARRPVPVAARSSHEEDEARRDLGGYYTPYRLARRLTLPALSDFDPAVSPVPAILDPACGAGTFLAASFDVLVERLEKHRRAHPDLAIEPVAWAVAALHGVEIDPTALWVARLSLAVRATRAERGSRQAGQLSLFGQAATYGPVIADRLRLGDALPNAPTGTVGGTERLRLRLIARDEPGRASVEQPRPIVWDTAFPLRFSNEEGSFDTAGGFQLVLTNPPFVPVDRIPAERRAELKAGLASMERRFDLFIGFVERARTLLAAGGRASLLIPRTFLTETNAERCRRLILETASLERIEELGDLKFDKARIGCVMLTFLGRRPTDTTALEVRRHGVRRPTVLLQSAFRRMPRAMFRIELADPAAEECLRVAAHSSPLGHFFCASWGARGSPVKDFHLDAPGHPLAQPMIKGDDVEPFRIRAASRWLLYDTERLYRPSRRELFEHDKLVVRKVTGARGLVCAVDLGRHYTDDSLACVVRKADLISIPMNERRRHRIRIAPSQIEPSRAYDLDLIAALLQTPLVQTYYRVQLGGGLNVFPDLVESLPLPKPQELGMPEAGELAQIGRTARAGGSFDAAEADRLARRLFKLA